MGKPYSEDHKKIFFRVIGRMRKRQQGNSGEAGICREGASVHDRWSTHKGNFFPVAAGGKDAGCCSISIPGCELV